MTTVMFTAQGRVSLSKAENLALTEVLAFLRQHYGDGALYQAMDVFPSRNAQDNAKRRTVRRLVQKGVLAACDVEVQAHERLRAMAP